MDGHEQFTMHSASTREPMPSTRLDYILKRGVNHAVKGIEMDDDDDHNPAWPKRREAPQRVASIDVRTSGQIQSFQSGTVGCSKHS